jgi:RNA polymerase sigma-70 factor, ECF subfamily
MAMPAYVLTTNGLPAEVAPTFPDVSRSDEMALVRQAVAGNAAAARSIYDAHVRAVFSLSSRIVGTARAAEVTQDAFVRTFERLHQFRGQSALRTWIHRVTVSVCLNSRRDERRRDRYVDLDELTSTIVVAAPECDPILRRRLHREIDRLPERLRTVFLMHVVEGYDHADIAVVLKIRVGTSKSRLSQARAALRVSLAGLSNCV